jgi:hypothetical protein
MFSINKKLFLKYYQQISLYIKFASVLYHCGVMKLSADMPPCLGGGDNRINVV